MPTAQGLGLIRPIGDALHAAHRADVVHRDLKPSNILIRTDETPILVDLGIAAVQSGPKLTRTGTLIGTPHYMSPEQARGEPADERSDIYALGVVLYEMLAGRLLRPRSRWPFCTPTCMKNARRSR
jgi:serine/threonine protein kinase